MITALAGDGTLAADLLGLHLARGQLIACGAVEKEGIQRESGAHSELLPILFHCNTFCRFTIIFTIFSSEHHTSRNFLVHRESTKTTNRFTEYLVRVETAEFFGEAVFERAAGQGYPLCGLSRLGQFSH